MFLEVICYDWTGNNVIRYIWSDFEVKVIDMTLFRVKS